MQYCNDYGTVFMGFRKVGLVSVNIGGKKFCFCGLLLYICPLKAAVGLIP